MSQNKKRTHGKKKSESRGQVKDPSPSYESERKDDQMQASGDKDSSSTRGLSLYSDVDEEEGEVTRLNQSEIQEGPKGGRPEHGDRRPAVREAPHKHRRSA